MRRIALLADSHNHLPPDLPARLREADEIWHLGDVSEEETLLPLYTLQKPLHIVRGNCDSNLSWPYIIDLEREGFFIRLIHIPPHAAPPGVDILCHGHTHLPRGERCGPTRYYNPGSIGKADRGAPPSFAWLELVRGEKPRWEVVRV